MLGLDTWQTVLFIILIVLCINYLSRIALDRITIQTSDEGSEYDGSKEGFTNSMSTDTAATESKYEVLTGDDIYDDFYASVYNKIFQHDKLVQAEAAICLQDWTKDMQRDQMKILDCCSGSGVASCYFAKEGVGSTVAMDKSSAMMRYAKNTILPATTLTEIQRQSIDWRLMDVLGTSSAMAAEFTHACLLYFTPYHFRDIDAVLKNLALWVRPGGDLAIEVVNKYKFEPIPDVANPWVAVTPQKYSKERITKAKAVFDKFDYESEFNLEDPRAEFRETFRFKDGSVRRQKHVLWMPSISDMIHKAGLAGWTYTKYTALDFIGFNYGYILFFKRNPN